MLLLLQRKLSTNREEHSKQMSTKKATSSVSAAPGGEGSSGSDSDSATQSAGEGHRDRSREPGRIRWTAEMVYIIKILFV